MEKNHVSIVRVHDMLKQNKINASIGSEVELSGQI